jgi:hypothetical protein
MPLAKAQAASQCVNFAQMFYFDNTFPSSQTHRMILCVENNDFAWFKENETDNLPKKEKSGSCWISDFPHFRQRAAQTKIVGVRFGFRS